MPKARSNKTGFNIMVVHFYIRRKLDIKQYMITQYGLEPVLTFTGKTDILNKHLY